MGDNTSFSRTDASYIVGYFDYIFYDNTHHYCLTESSNATTTVPSVASRSASFTYTWTLNGISAEYATINNNGVINYSQYVTHDVTATVKLIATSQSDSRISFTATQEVTFSAPRTDPEGISITSGNSMTVYTGQTGNIAYTLTPANCYNNVTFTSANTSIATVSDNGTVTGVAVGQTTITVQPKLIDGTDASFNATITVTVRGKVATPEISFEQNDSDNGESATTTITCETDRASISYTTDGTTPTSGSYSYTGTFTASNNVTVKAIAIKDVDGWDNSEVASSTYVRRVLPTPTIQINNGSVTFTCSEPGVTFRYTTGATPTDPTPSTTTTWTEGLAPITTGITNEHIIKVIATKSGWSYSAVASRQYIQASGVSGGVVTLNDLEDHTWTLYQGVNTTDDDGNYNTNYAGKLYFSNPCDVKITYKANGGAVSISESADKFVYYKTLAKEGGSYKYTTIPNPFSKRPKNNGNYQGFSKWKITNISGGTITGLAVNSEVDAETELTFNPTSEYGMEVEFEVVWTRAYVVTCTAGQVNSKLNSSDLKGGSYETNFIVITGGNSNTDLNAGTSKKVTITMVTPDGATDYRGNSVYINPSVITLSNDWKFEYININARSFTKSYGSGWNTTSETINTIITANNHYLVLGRGISHTTGNISAGTVEGMTNVNSSANLNYKIRVESGVYDYLTFVNGYNARYGQVPPNMGYTSDPNVEFSGSNIHIGGVLGCDYDRASSNNNLLKIRQELVMGYSSKFTNTSNINNETLNVTAKSGKFHSEVSSDVADADESFYVSLGGAQTNVGRRVVNIEGGQFLSIAGGIDQNNNATNETFYVRMSGGHVRGAIYGCGAFAATSGHRRFIFTGGQIDGWIAAGCNGTDVSQAGGTLPSDTYVYIGGNTTVGYKNGTTPPHINTSDGGNVFGAGSGNSAQATTGQVNNSNVVIADGSYVQNNVFGGGNYGYSNETAKVYVTGGTVAGMVFGGSNQKQGNTVNLCMTGGLVKGGVYGGSNVTGTISNNVTMQINGGQVGTSTTPANIHGGGYGSGTGVTKNVDITLGKTGAARDADGVVVYGDVYGGSALGSVNGTSATNTYHTNVTMNAGTIHGSLYGGGLGNSTTAANVYGPVAVKVYGGSVKKTDVDGSGGVYGCNNINGAPQGAVTVDIYGTNSAPAEDEYALFSVYGGGNKADYTPDDDELWPEVTIHNCNNSIEYVYGGGNAAAVNSTSVTIYGGNKIGNVFGGGNGISGTAADVDGIASVQIHGGIIGNVFGGSNSTGEIGGDIEVNIYPSAEGGGTPCPMEIDNVYGGGNMAPSQAGIIAISCGDNLTYDFHIGNVYGGANAADIDGDIQLDITAGKIDNVFGGNNTSGAIDGTITVNIDESEPSCGMAIGNVYGGGNNAAYSAPDATKGYPEVNIKKGTVLHDVFGGGLGSSATVNGNPQVKMTGGLVGGTLYGGGSAAPVTGNPHVKMNVSTHSGTGEAKSDTWWDVKGYVFGGGLGESAKVTGSTKVEILGTSRVGKNVYGGGNGGAVTGNTDVIIGE